MADLPAIESFSTASDLHDAAADLLSVRLNDAVALDGVTAFAAAGGSTPAPVYERLARRRAPWGAITVTLTDERWTPPTSAQSNEALIQQTLLRDQAAAASFQPLWSAVSGPEPAADLADARLAALPAFGAVLLGMGTDGHIASLFPGSPALAEGLNPSSPRRCIAVPPGDPAPDIWRLSLTLSCLRRTALTLVLITGTDKRAVLQEGRSDRPIHTLIRHSISPLRIFWAP